MDDDEFEQIRASIAQRTAMTNPIEIITNLFLNEDECLFYKNKTIQITPDEAYLHAQRTASKPRARRRGGRILWKRTGSDRTRPSPSKSSRS